MHITKVEISSWNWNCLCFSFIK